MRRPSRFWSPDWQHKPSFPSPPRAPAPRASGGEPILLGGYHYAAAMAYAPGWFAANEERIEVLHTDDPAPFAARLDELSAAPSSGFWTLWAPRGKEGRLLPGLFAEHLPSRHADSSKKTSAGILQHFPGR